MDDLGCVRAHRYSDGTNRHRVEQEKRFHTCQRFYGAQAPDRPYTGVSPSFPAAAAADVLCHNTLGIGVTLFNPVEGGEGTENLRHTGVAQYLVSCPV